MSDLGAVGWLMFHFKINQSVKGVGGPLVMKVNS